MTDPIIYIGKGLFARRRGSAPDPEGKGAGRGKNGKKRSFFTLFSIFFQKKRFMYLIFR